MEYSLVSFTQLSNKERMQMAVLHHAVMQTLLSDLGLPVVLRYYEIAAADPHVVGFCACSAPGAVLGWAAGSPYPDQINARLRSPFGWFVHQMIRVVLTRPLVLWQLISSFSSLSGQGEMRPGTIELTYIGVASQERGKGIGEKLVDAFLEASRSRGYGAVALSVEKENLPAIALYEKKGFQIVNTFSEGRYRRHRMELTLA